MFSTNDQVDELPTSSLHFLLVHAYLAYMVQEIHVEREKRKTYLISAKVCNFILLFSNVYQKIYLI